MLRILRAAALGAVLFALLTLTPTLLVWWYGPKPARADAEAPAAPRAASAASDATRPPNEADRQVKQGIDAARSGGIASHAECAARFEHLVRLGCSRFVTEQKAFPPAVKQGDWGGGKTTAQCEAEVNAYWAPRVQDLREQGQLHAAQTWQLRQWTPELRQCRNYDAVRGGGTAQAPVPTPSPETPASAAPAAPPPK